MQTYPLRFFGGHLYATVDGRDWLLDTGCPTSFGVDASLTVAQREFRVAREYMGLNAETLGGYVGHEAAGLLGGDILNRFHVLFDVPGEEIRFSEAAIALSGACIELDQFMGIPMLAAEICGAPRRMFFDTGAQVSYFQGEGLQTFPPAGTLRDFYPGIGPFDTETFLVDVQIGPVRQTVRCGALPGLLGATLMMAGAEGILGNEFLVTRVVCYCPEAGQLVVAGTG